MRTDAKAFQGLAPSSDLMVFSSDFGASESLRGPSGDKMAEQNPRQGFFSMGNETLSVPMALFAENRSLL